jgi:hypothetical protein
MGFHGFSQPFQSIVGEYHKIEQQSGPLKYLTIHQKTISEFNDESLNQGSLTETLSGLRLEEDIGGEAQPHRTVIRHNI